MAPPLPPRRAAPRYVPRRGQVLMSVLRSILSWLPLNLRRRSRRRRGRLAVARRPPPGQRGRHGIVAVEPEPNDVDER
ncbi:hypothetical protein ABZP36_010459 [Zizania latifolia]